MNEPFAEIILAARDSDIGSWTNIIFVVVIAIFYLVGSIVKAKANKPEEEEAEPASGKPRPRPSQGPIAPRPLQKRPYQQPQRPARVVPQRPPQPVQRRAAYPQPAVPTFTVQKEARMRLGAIKPPAEPELELPSVRVKPRFEKLKKLHVQVGKGLKAQEPAAPGIAGLLDLEDSDALKRAILHYEILGKPLSLRDPSGHIA